MPSGKFSYTILVILQICLLRENQMIIFFLTFTWLAVCVLFVLTVLVV